MLPISMIEKKIKIPVKEWKGDCYTIACQMIKKKIVNGKSRYGLWLGPISVGSLFYGKKIVNHGWIDGIYGNIIDPTRWVFEDVEPYIFVGGDIDDYYDMGAQSLRKTFLEPPPEFDYSKETKKFSKSVSKETYTFIKKLLFHPYVTDGGLFWIANLPLDNLKNHAKEVYQGLEKAGMKAFVPIDNWEFVME